MAISIESKQKAKIINENQQTGSKDTGSTEVQIALLTTKIKQLTEHFKKHIHDYHSRLGLQKMVSKRRKLLKYLKAKHRDRYVTLIKRLGIRGSV